MLSDFHSRWYYRNKQGRNESIEHIVMTTSGRYKVKESRLIIQSIEQSDNAIFYCIATNDQGSETLEIQLKIVAPLQAHIHPQRQTVDVGKSAELVRISIHLITSVVSKKLNYCYYYYYIPQYSIAFSPLLTKLTRLNRNA